MPDIQLISASRLVDAPAPVWHHSSSQRRCCGGTEIICVIRGKEVTNKRDFNSVRACARRPSASRGSASHRLARDQDVARYRLVDSVPKMAVRAVVENLKAGGGECGGGVLAAGDEGVP